MQGPAVAYRALFLTGEDPCNHNARSSGSSFPHIQRRSYPLQLSPRIVTGSSREKLQGGTTKSTHQTRVGLCGVRNFTTIPIPAVAYPNQGEIRISFPKSTSDTRVTEDLNYLSFPLQLSSPPLLLLYCLRLTVYNCQYPHT